jgi:hypothetical protein
MPTEAENLIGKNNLYIGRREVGAEAIKSFNAQDHTGQSDDVQLALLTVEVNKAAAHNAHLTPENKTRVALEWDVSINGGAHTKQEVLGFVRDARDAVSGEIPQLPVNADYGVDLSTLKVAEMSTLQKIQLGMAVQERAKVSALDLNHLAEMNGKFEAAAQNNNLINYADGQDLTKLFDGIDTTLTDAQKTNKAAELQKFATGPSAAAQTAPQSGQEEDGLGWLKNMGDGLGGFVAVIIAFLSGMFGGGNKGDNEKHKATQEAMKKFIDNTAQNLSKLKGADGKYSAATVDTNKDGVIDMKEIGTVMAGQNPDLNKDGKLDKDEKATMLGNLDAVAKYHPEVKEIALTLKKSLQGIDDTGHVNAALPGAGRDISKDASR